MAEFAVGDRVLYDSDPSDRLNGHEVAGEIVSITHHIALIRPDDAGPGIMVTTRHIRDIRRKENDGQGN